MVIMKPLVNITVIKLASLMAIGLCLVQCASVEPHYEGITPLAVDLGRASGCQVSASHSLGQNHSKIRLAATSAKRYTYADLFTGRTLTNTQVLSRVGSAFARAANASPGNHLLTLGNLKYGGTAEFEALPGGGVRVQYYGNANDTCTFHGDEVQVLARLIDRALRG